MLVPRPRVEVTSTLPPAAPNATLKAAFAGATPTAGASARASGAWFAGGSLAAASACRTSRCPPNGSARAPSVARRACRTKRRFSSSHAEKLTGPWDDEDEFDRRWTLGTAAATRRRRWSRRRTACTAAGGTSPPPPPAPGRGDPNAAGERPLHRFADEAAGRLSRRRARTGFDSRLLLSGGAATLSSRLVGVRGTLDRSTERIPRVLCISQAVAHRA